MNDIEGFWDRIDLAVQYSGMGKLTFSKMLGFSHEYFRSARSERELTGLNLKKLCIAVGYSSDYMLGLDKANYVVEEEKKPKDNYWQRIKKACYSAGMTLAEVSKKMGCGKRYLDRNIIHDQGYMSTNRLARFCKTTNVTSDWLLGLKRKQ